ncbi:type II toxin-antitoxin system RelE family toxin [Brevibacterium aurantiacum]|uniref:Plasmid stabilization protein n=1 Tax=Brevibacterium aurantiacum TaxID=273384 RepID=A0A2H1KPX0_BREAU|nr:type II toxin-antitoxin system RelE/ParE family toxin [Brevibacterium aurantiacum]AZL09759.1 plasmid stabilization protein [Brevibacterium aurantiacum]AZT93913.1 plasmid stabilization protein [Brevibacterium aurantiacum]SMY01863.1 mRNA interferase RelE/StbE [Brevibacterium aurantiacum]
MSYSISYVSSAAKTLRKLDKPVARRLLATISQLAEDPRPAGCIQLKGGDGELRIRVGEYRVIYEIYGGELLVLVLRVGHRREVYR